MARFTLNLTAKTATTQGPQSLIAPGADPVALADTVDTDVDAVKTATAALETEVIALDALSDLAVAAKVASAARTAVVDAMAVLQADGASPTEAHVDTADTAWIAVNSAITALHTAVDNVKTASAAAETNTIAADALADTAVASVVTLEAAVGADMQLSVNASNVTTRNAAREGLRNMAHMLESGYGGLSA